MRMIKAIVSVLLLLAVAVSAFSVSAEASGRNRAAGQAYANAIENGTIEVYDDQGYVIADMNGDGVKDLLLSDICAMYSYKGGRIKKLDIPSEYGGITYNKKMKSFLDHGAGDYAWITVYKIKNGKVVEKCSYESDYRIGNKSCYICRYPSGKIKKISEKKFSKMRRRANKINRASKSQLISKLRNLR